MASVLHNALTNKPEPKTYDILAAKEYKAGIPYKLPHTAAFSKCY